MRKSGLRALVFWMVLVFGGLACTVAFGWKPLLGLDLQGGLSATLTPKAGTNPTTQSVQEAAAIIRQRVDGLGIAEPSVVRSGRTVIVELPGLKKKADQDRAKKIIGTTAKLEFRKVIRDLGPADLDEPRTPRRPSPVRPRRSSPVRRRRSHPRRRRRRDPPRAFRMAGIRRAWPRSHSPGRAPLPSRRRPSHRRRPQARPPRPAGPRPRCRS